MKNGRIYVITHKPVELTLPEHYQKLYVGAEKLSEEEKRAAADYVFDDNGDNISEKNSNYCELTGLYWIWKNCKDDIVGISHYRRFFVQSGNLLSLKSAEDILEHADAIVSKRWWVSGNIQENFAKFHNREDLMTIRKIIGERHPEYCGSFDKAMSKCFLFPYNMMICKRKMFNDYCEWLFDILEECEKRVNLNGYDAYQKRIYGFLSERLWLVYLIHHNAVVKEMKVRETELSIWRWLERFICGIVFILRNLRKGRGVKAMQYGK